MTRVAERRTKLAGETNVVVQGRPLMVTVGPHEIEIRPKGKRCTFSVPILALYQLGARIASNEARRLKAEARKQRRGK